MDSGAEIGRGGHLLLLTTDDGHSPGGGRELLSRLLHGVLGELHGRVSVLRLTGRSSALGGLRGQLHGLDGAAGRELAGLLADETLTGVFLDGSNLGAAARMVGKIRPDLPVMTFFHNCETRFFADALRAAPGPRALAVLAGHWQAERLALRHSTCRIALSQRDSAELARRFGTGADVVLPMALEDRRDPAAVAVERTEPFALFVGGGFYGNLDGLRWYAREVAPRLAIPTLVVGRGLEALAGHLPANMELVGPVDDLSPWYAGAALVVAPIRAGSGMKTKLAEALMHGKRVVGTAEAFSGYGAEVLAANRCEDDPARFAGAVADLVGAARATFDPALRGLYERFHSRAALRDQLGRILR